MACPHPSPLCTITANRPIKQKINDKYLIEDYTGDEPEKMKDMPMDAVMSSIFFLWNLGLELSTVMTNYLDSQETELLTQHLSSQKNGVGTEQFLHSLKATLDDFKISLN